MTQIENTIHVSSYLKLLLLCVPLITLYNGQIITQLTPHPYITISLQMFVIYYLYTHEKSIPQKLRFARQYIIFIFTSWIIGLLIGQIDDIVTNVYKIEYSNEIIFCIKILMTLASVEANIDLAFKKSVKKKYQDSQQFQHLEI